MVTVFATASWTALREQEEWKQRDDQHVFLFPACLRGARLARPENRNVRHNRTMVAENTSVTRCTTVHLPQRGGNNITRRPWRACGEGGAIPNVCAVPVVTNVSIIRSCARHVLQACWKQ